MGGVSLGNNIELFKWNTWFSETVDLQTAKNVGKLAKPAPTAQQQTGNATAQKTEYVVIVGKKDRDLYKSEILSDFMSKAASLDGYFKMFKQTGELLQHLFPSEAVWERMTHSFGVARDMTAPWYLLFTVNTLVNSTGKAIDRRMKACSDVVGAVCINVMAASKLVFNRSVPLAGRVLTFTSFFSDTLELKEQAVNFVDAGKDLKQAKADGRLTTRLTEGRRVAFLKSVAAITAVFCGAIAISTLALSASPLPLVVVLSAAVGGTAIKNFANFYESARSNELLSPDPVFVS